LKEGEFALSGPIVKDKLLFRVSGDYTDKDGQITNTFLNEKNRFLQGKGHPSKAAVAGDGRLYRGLPICSYR